MTTVIGQINAQIAIPLSQHLKKKGEIKNKRLHFFVFVFLFFFFSENNSDFIVYLRWIQIMSHFCINQVFSGLFKIQKITPLWRVI